MRFNGHKAAVVADVETGLVTAVDVMEGSSKDDEGSLELVKEAAVNTGLEVEAALADCAYGSGENRRRFADADIALLAKVAKSATGDFFTKDQFEIDLEAMSCRCPADQVTTHLVKAGYQNNEDGERVAVQAFRFSIKVCGVCPLRTACSKDNGQPRLIRLNPYEVLLQAARQWQASPDFDTFRKQRQVIEHRIARLVQLGIRQARYCGRHKTLFQVLMAAAVANLTLVAASGGVGRTPQRNGTLVSALLSSQTFLVWVSRGLRTLFQPSVQGQLASSLVVAARPHASPTIVKMAGFRPGL